MPRPSGGTVRRDIALPRGAGFFAFAPDSKTIAVTTTDEDFNGLVLLFDVVTGEQLWNVTRNSNVYTLSFTPDGQTLAAGGWVGDGDVALYSVATGAVLGRFFPGSRYNAAVYSTSFSPDGRVLAIGSSGPDNGGYVSVVDVTPVRATAPPTLSPRPTPAPPPESDAALARAVAVATIVGALLAALL